MKFLGPDMAAYIDTHLEMYMLRNCPIPGVILLSPPEWELFCGQNGYSSGQPAQHYFNRAGAVIEVVKDTG